MAFDWQREARRAAKRYNLDPDIYVAQIRQESGGNPHAVSPAGARGIAQIMPGTAKAWKVDPNDPRQSLDVAAREMSRYVRRFGSYRKALAAYNAGEGAVLKYNGVPPYAETRNYVQTILKGVNRRPQMPGQQPAQTDSTTTSAPTAPSQPMVAMPTPDPVAPVTAPTAPISAQQNLPIPTVNGQNGPSAFTLPSAAPQPAQEPTVVMPEQTVQQGVEAPETAAQPVQSKGRVNVAGGANRKGVNLSKGFRGFTDQMAANYGDTIDLTTGTNHNQYTTTGNVSDHWAGNAGDFGIGKDMKKGDAIATAALITAGVDPKKASSMARKGGVWSFNHKGYRVQILWRTQVGGDHTNHVHVGVKKIK